MILDFCLDNFNPPSDHNGRRGQHTVGVKGDEEEPIGPTGEEVQWRHTCCRANAVETRFFLEEEKWNIMKMEEGVCSLAQGNNPRRERGSVVRTSKVAACLGVATTCWE